MKITDIYTNGINYYMVTDTGKSDKCICCGRGDYSPVMVCSVTVNKKTGEIEKIYWHKQYPFYSVPPSLRPWEPDL